MNTHGVLVRAVEHYGECSQKIMFFEELMELYESINRGERESIVEEIADTSICLKQIFIIFGLKDDHFTASGEDEIFVDIMTNSILFVCRASRERNANPESLYLLAGWLRARAQSMDAVEDVQRIAGEKIERLKRRMEND
jgi:hypothetical protein